MKIILTSTSIEFTILFVGRSGLKCKPKGVNRDATNFNSVNKSTVSSGK